MANQLIAMHLIRKIYRLHAKGLSKIQIAQRLKVSRNTVKKYLRLLAEEQLDAVQLGQLSDAELLRRFSR